MSPHGALQEPRPPRTAVTGRESGAGFAVGLSPSPPTPLPRSGGAGSMLCFLMVMKAHVGRAKLLLSRRSFEPSWGSAGASPSQECRYGSRIRCRFAVGLSPSPPTPLPRFRGRGEDFRFQLAVGGDGRSFLSRDTGSATPRFCWERGAARTCFGTRFFRMRSTAWLGLHAVL